MAVVEVMERGGGVGDGAISKVLTNRITVYYTALRHQNPLHLARLLRLWRSRSLRSASLILANVDFRDYNRGQHSGGTEKPGF